MIKSNTARANCEDSQGKTVKMRWDHVGVKWSCQDGSCMMGSELDINKGRYSNQQGNIDMGNWLYQDSLIELVIMSWSSIERREEKRREEKRR